MIKKYHSEKFRQKFRRYRLFFLFSLILFLMGLIGEICFYGSFGFQLFPSKVDLKSFFLPLLCAEGLLYLLIFFFGITIYAPFFGFLFSFLRGALSGFCLSASYLYMKEKGGFLLLFFTLFYLLSSAWLFLGYSTFCTTAALSIYSSHGGNEKMKQFGGSLFRSTYFCGSINLRFLSSYFLFFLTSLFFASLVSFVYAFFRSLFLA